MRSSVGVVSAMAVTACLALTGCSGSGSTPSQVAPSGTVSASPTEDPTLAPTTGLVTPPPPNNPVQAARARQVVVDYFAALFDDAPYKACVLLTAAYKRASIEEGAAAGVDPTDDCPTAITKAVIDVLSQEKLRPGAFKVGRGTTAGDRATVPVFAPAGFEDVTYVLTRSGTGWLIDGEG